MKDMPDKPLLWGGQLPEQLQTDTEYVAFAAHIRYPLEHMTVDELEKLDDLYADFWENADNHARGEGSES